MNVGANCNELSRILFIYETKRKALVEVEIMHDSLCDNTDKGYDLDNLQEYGGVATI